MKPLLSEWAWQQQGNCVGTDPELFFLPDNARQGYKSKLERAAKRVCVGCPVIAECLAHALSVPEKVGVWGGLTADERLLLGAANE